MHWLGIDVGRKRIGLAISDPQTKIATALGTIEFKTNDFAGAAVLVKKKLTHAGYCPVVCVLGWPAYLSGQTNASTQMVQTFADALKAQYPQLTLHYQNEYASTVAAQTLLADAGLKASVRRRAVDSVSALIILQAYLDAHK